MSDRTISTDALATLGTVIGPDEKRDAIHLAVIAIEASEGLRPGENVRLLDGKAVSADDRDGHGSLGIVDPFLRLNVRPGQWFWLVIYPRVITSLRHVWTHPAIPDELHSKASRFTKEESKDFLENVASRLGIDFEYFGERHFDGSSFRVDIDGGDCRQVPYYFYEHYENYFGFKIPESARTDWFSCGC